MDAKLEEAALSGCVEDFLMLHKENPEVLEDVAVATADNPLHIAAKFGHLAFVKAIMSFKPCFAWELNQDGFSPMNLATENGHVGIVKELLAYDPKLHILKDRDGRTPFHCAAIYGRIEILKEFRVMSLDDCLEEVTARGETALHLALKNKQEEAFVLLMDWTKQTQKEKLLDWKDRAGNSVLQLASSNNSNKGTQFLRANSNMMNRLSKERDAKTTNLFQEHLNDQPLPSLMILSDAVQFIDPFKSTESVFGQHTKEKLPCEYQDLCFNHDGNIVKKLQKTRDVDVQDESSLLKYSHDADARNMMSITALFTLSLAANLLCSSCTQHNQLPKTTGILLTILLFFLVLFIMMGIISAFSVILLIQVAGLPQRQSLLLIISVLSTASSYACAIAIFSPIKCLTAPFLVLAFLGLLYYIVILQRKGGLNWGLRIICSRPFEDMEDTASFT